MMLVLAMTTRGASLCVANTATGMPDCTTSVSSSPRSLSAATMAWYDSQLRAHLPIPP